MTNQESDDPGAKNSIGRSELSKWWNSGITRRRFLGTSAAAAGAFFLHQDVFAQNAGAANVNWDVLKSKVKGEVVTASSPSFASIRSDMVWNNIKPNRTPDVIVKVKDVHDIVEAINFARENKIKVTVHGGGHNWVGLAVRNGGMIVEIAGLNESTIDKEKKKAVIQPVISNREIAKRLGEYDLAFPIGHCPTVKASGYLLNGGMSWNMGRWGPGCLSVEAIEFVTADGKMITASATEHPDLFWAARGCGPGMFAVAHRFHLKCFELPKAIMASTYFYSLKDLKEAATEAVALGRKCPDNVELSLFMIKAPADLADKCKEYNGMVFMVGAVAFGMTKAESEAALAPLEAGAMAKNQALKKTLNEESNFEKLSDNAGASWPENHRNHCENQCSKADPVKILMALRDKFVQAPSDQSVVVFCQSTGPKNLLVPHPEVALSMDASSYGGIWSIWKEEKDDAANTKWHNEMVKLLAPFTNQHYIGETDIVQDPSRIEQSYSKEKWKRMEEIRAKYDPNGVFFGFGGLKKA